MSAVIDRFTAMSEAELREYFHTCAIVEITDMVSDTSDEELQQLVDLDSFRDETVLAILERVEEFADAERLAQVEGLVRFELTGSKNKTVSHTARFAGGKVTLDPERHT